jgi:hypothetical protein
MFYGSRMSTFASKRGFAILLAVLCLLPLGGRTARAQVAPVRYWIPGGPFGFGGSSTAGQVPDAYGNFPSFDAEGTRGGGFNFGRTNLPSGFFLGGASSSAGLSGISQAGAFGNAGGGLSYDSVQFGYNFKGAGGTPVTLFAGVDTLKYNAISSPASFTSGAYGVHAGLEFQPVPNVSLSFGVGYAQPQSGRIDSDINSSLLPGESPIFSRR